MGVESDGELSQMMRAVEILLLGIGEDVQREGLVKTPLRVASAFRGALAGYQQSAREIVGSALFTEAGLRGETGCGGGSGGIVVVSSIDSFSLCEACLLPFRLRCHVAYIACGERVVGLSKFARVAEMFAKRLQNPQKFANEVVEALDDSFSPLGVGIVVESWHLRYPGFAPDCIDDRARSGSGLGWISTVVQAGKGQFENFPGWLWDEFLTILQLEGVDLRKSLFSSAKRRLCPFAVHNAEQGLSVENFDPNIREIYSNGIDSSDVVSTTASANISPSASALAKGVESLLCTVGAMGIGLENLRCPAARFVNWFTLATQGGIVTLPISPERGSDKFFAHGNTQNSGYGNEVLSNAEMKDNVSNIAAVYSNGDSHAAYNHSSHQIEGASEGAERLRTGRDHESSSNGNYSPSDVNHDGMDRESSTKKLSSWPGTWSVTESALRVELDIPFSTLCEHHLLPFFGVLHVGYICTKGGSRQHIGRSLLSRIVSIFSRRLQAQERLTRQIAEAVVSLPGLEGGAMVVADASHMCMMSRGVVKLGCTTATVATFGQFSTEQAVRAEFLRRLPRKEQAKNLMKGY